MPTETDDDALARAMEIARKNPEWKIDERLVDGRSWDDVAMTASFFCEMASLGLKPWMRPPCHAHITEPRVDVEGAALLKRMLALGFRGSSRTRCSRLTRPRRRRARQDRRPLSQRASQRAR